MKYEIGVVQRFVPGSQKGVANVSGTANQRYTKGSGAARENYKIPINH
jgi:hypothetical protein